MIDIAAIELARIQFAFTVSFHIIFPATTIGLATFIAVLEGLWLKTRREVYYTLCRFWSRAFALCFAIGVVSGIVMSYQFGTNWSVFSNFAGSITGPLLTYEVLTAFFLEAGFLGIMLFGWNKVGPRAHFAATVAVATGTLISMFWILASNSWMQTPAGYRIVDGRVMPVDWMAIVFNPSFPYRFMHMALAVFAVSMLLVSATSAWHLLRNRDNGAMRTSLVMALGCLLVVTPLQALVGDAHGLNTLKYQPAKLAAIEGLWDVHPEGTPLNLFGLPDMEAETTRYSLGIPHLGSLILTHSWTGAVPNMKRFPKQDRPDSRIVFWSFRIMVGLGMLMIVLAVTGAWLHRRGRLQRAIGFLRFAVAMGPAGYVSLLAGWITSEVGRQPWVVYGLLRTSQAASPVTRQQVGLSLLIFVTLYTLVFGTGLFYLFKILRTGPEPAPALPLWNDAAARPSGRHPLQGASLEHSSRQGDNHA
ncbi:cytochrome ubiquinol oxidase subunit I [Paludibacterium yongneupense]|uniref:cytochrome ubiquinol oxidase subunit I n=1 Tax=Paludibacterium yongneupense TaxID=400061 RepID=UPI0003FB7E4D|nr:cytochrome ubiquinol oxidase subunit I [Paludibacterium yongneupense]